MGLLTIVTLKPDQRAPRCTSRAGLIIKGQQFVARFTPTQPAMINGSPDPAVPSLGNGRFIPSQLFARAG
jgi:hypothetical protein